MGYGGQGYGYTEGGYGYGATDIYSPLGDPFAAAFFDPNVGLYEARTGSSATDAVVQRTDSVGTWRSVNGTINGTAATDAARPTWHPFGINSTPGVLFDGTQTRLSFVTNLADLFRNKQYVYVFFVAKPTAEATAGAALFWTTNSTSSARFGATFNSGGLSGRLNIGVRRLDADSITSVNLDSAFTNGEVCCFAVEVGYADGDLNVWKGETQIHDGSISGTPAASSNTASAAAWVGANNAGTSWYDGQLGHWLVCTTSRKLTTPEIMERQRWMMRQVAFSQITPPAGLSITPAIEVWTNGSTYRTTFDRSLHDVTRAATFYVDPVNGSGLNDGLSELTPLATLTSAITKANLETSAEIILMQAGTGYSGGGGAVAVSVPITIRCRSGLAILSQGVGGRSFVADEGSTWKATSHSATHVYDFANRNQYGAPQQLTQASTLAECRATRGTFIVDAGTTYVHLFDGRQPDSSVCTTTSTTGRRLNFTGSSVFLENIAHVGSNNNNLYVGHAGNTVLAAVNCEFHHATQASSDNVSFDVDGASYLVNCLVTGAGADNIDYRDGTTGSFVGYEINTQSHQAGRSGASAANCTTAHEGCKVVRVNGRYFRPLHRAVHDVNSGTESWNINCQAEAGTATDNYPPGAWSVGLNDADAPEMYLDNCAAFGSADHFQVFGANSRLYYRNMNLTGTQTGADKMEAY